MFTGMTEVKKEPQMQVPAAQKVKCEGYADANINVEFEIDNKDPMKPDDRRIVATFNNLTAEDITGLNMQVAVQKHVKMTTLFPVSESTVRGNKGNKVIQEIKVSNTMDGIKPIAMKIKIAYTYKGQTVTGTKLVSFPINA